MSNLSLFQELEQLLRAHSQYTSEDSVMLKNSIVEAALQLRPDLLQLVLSNEKLKANFFTEVEDILVFDKVRFQKFVMNKRFLPDSYTSFKNKIGLTTDEGDFLADSREVVLSWPYKDCVLEGGQTKEDAKRNEVFWNEILAPDEINRLTEPKALTNFKKYDADGEHKVESITKADNLIIKGNNLLALHSLKKTYAGQVKLIYIDPPYYFSQIKKEDTFAYNSNFKLSTWLSFMRNRLTIAKNLLSSDGALFVQISDDGVGELHLLMKEIFNEPGVNNFINKITVKTKSPSGFASVNAGVFETAEYILAFGKKKSQWKYNTQFVKSEYDPNYKWYIPNRNESYKEWGVLDLFEFIAHEKGYSNVQLAKKGLGELVFMQFVSEFALTNSDFVFRYTAIGDDAGQQIVEIRDKSKKHKEIIFEIERINHYDVYVNNGQEIAFYSKKIKIIEGELAPSIQLSNMWMDTPYEGIAKEGDVTLKGGKKPEKLIRRIIDMATNEGDIVLDFHLGSGTTAAVAHKMCRKYIGIEQLDYGQNDSVVRLQNVIGKNVSKDMFEKIECDKTGISKAVNWKGGGSFVYCELAKANQELAERILASENKEELSNIWEQMQETGFLSWKVNPKQIDENADDFAALSVEDTQKFLLEALDKNLLYIPYSEIDNQEFGISDNDKRLNAQFYGKA